MALCKSAPTRRWRLPCSCWCWTMHLLARQKGELFDEAGPLKELSAPARAQGMGGRQACR